MIQSEDLPAVPVSEQMPTRVGVLAAARSITEILPPTPLLVDNQSAVFSVNNPETSQRTRHLDVRYFKVRDYIKQQKVRVRHISTNLNVADFFTKASDSHLFSRYRDYLGMENHAPPRRKLLRHRTAPAQGPWGTLGMVQMGPVGDRRGG